MRLRQDLAHIGRVSALGELTASLAHELSQPLTAILSNAQAAQRLLDADVVELEKVREILCDIVADDKRAAAVISGLRGLIKKGETEFVPLDLNEVVGAVAWLMRSDTIMRNVSMSLELASDLPKACGDRVQLQQVVLNLVLNGLEAMREPHAGPRTLVIRTARDGAARPGHGARTPAPASPRRISGTSSNRSTRPRPRGWAWAWPSYAPSSTRTAARWGPRTTRRAGRACVFTLPVDREAER